MLSKLTVAVIGVAIGCIIATPFLLLNIIRILVRMRKEPDDVQ